MLLSSYTSLPDMLTLICTFVWSIALLGHNLTTLVARTQFWYILMNPFRLKCKSLPLLDPCSWNTRDYSITHYVACHCWSQPPVEQHTTSNIEQCTVLTQSAHLRIWAKITHFLMRIVNLKFFRDQIFRQVNDVFWTINTRILTTDRIIKRALISVLFFCSSEAL